MSLWQIILYILGSLIIIYFFQSLYSSTGLSSFNSTLTNTTEDVEESKNADHDEYVAMRTSNPSLDVPDIPPPAQSHIDHSMLQHQDMPVQPMQHQFGQGQIPTSMPSRGGPSTGFAPILGDEAQFDPVQPLLNPIPNDRLMPISGAKDDPIKTRMDTMDHMGLYSHILEKDMGQYDTTHKNRFQVSNGPRDTPFHINGVADKDAFAQQSQFMMGRPTNAGEYIQQPKHPHFDLGIQINYKKLDHELSGNRSRTSDNLMGLAASR